MDSSQNYRFPFKVDWYQTETNVILVIFKKGLIGEVRIIDQKERLLEFELETDEAKYRKVINFYEKIGADLPRINLLPTKIEIKLKKAQSKIWNRLEEPKNEITSPKVGKNWDEVAGEIDDEQLEGEAKLNKFFQDIYARGTDETKKAMIKSFTESAGTELSTNWDDVGKKTVDIKPPDGLEWKSW